MFAPLVNSLKRLWTRFTRASGLAKPLADAAGTRWYLLIDILPQALGICVVRVILDALHFPFIFDGDTVGGFSNSAFFLSAILLSGVLEDYKESEGMPAELAACFDSLSESYETASLMQRRRADSSALLDSRMLNLELLCFLENVFEFLGGFRDDCDVLASLTTHSKFAAIEVGAADTAIDATRVLDKFDEIRGILLRAHVIKTTDFLPSGYSLLDVLVWVTIIMTLLQKHDNGVTAAATTVLASIQFLYMSGLLRDIDDP